MVEYKTIEKDGGETNEHKIRGNEWMSERASEIEGSTIVLLHRSISSITDPFVSSCCCFLSSLSQDVDDDVGIALHPRGREREREGERIIIVTRAARSLARSDA